MVTFLNRFLGYDVKASGTTLDRYQDGLGILYFIEQHQRQLGQPGMGICNHR